MGIIGGVFAFSSVAGPLIGGWITEGPGWRWAFWLNLPLAILSILAVIFLLPHRPFREREKHSIDYLGSLILMAGTSALVLATIWGGNQYEWTFAADYRPAGLLGGCCAGVHPGGEPCG